MKLVSQVWRAFLLCAIVFPASFAAAQARPFPGPDVREIYQRLLPQIEKIPAFDHHAHPTKTFGLAIQYHGKVPQVISNNS